MPPWHITSVVPPDIVQEDPKHFQFQFRGESINENDLFLLVPATDKTENKKTAETEHQAIKKTGQRAGNELHKVFWRAFVAYREENNVNPEYKHVWEMIYDFLLETQSIEDYDDAGGAWPVAVDEFVEWIQEQAK